MTKKKFTVSVMLTWRGMPQHGWTEQQWAMHILNEIVEREICGGSLAVESLTLLSVTDAPNNEDDDF